MPIESLAALRDVDDPCRPERRTADRFDLALATFQKADRELESLGRAVNRAEDAVCDCAVAEREVEAAERRWWRQYRRAHAAALNVLRAPTSTPEAARHKWEILRRYFEGGDARSSKALLRSTVTSGCFTAAANAPMESRDDQWLAGREPGRAEEKLGYELHLDGGDWIVLHDGVEEARYVRADQALAHARQGLRDQGKDEWSFRLGFSGR